MEDAISILVASWRDEDRNRILTALTGQNDFFIAGIEKDEAGALIKSAYLKPDVLILDLHLPEISGLELAPIIRRRSPETYIVMLCDKDEDDYAGMALRAGISGFLLKKADTAILSHVVKIVCSGGFYISASIISRVFNAAAIRREQLSGQKTNLLFSQTERKILTCVARGLKDEETAKHLNLSLGTVRNSLSKIRRKTKAKNHVQIVDFSLKHGLINFSMIQYNE